MCRAGCSQLKGRAGCVTGFTSEVRFATGQHCPVARPVGNGSLFLRSIWMLPKTGATGRSDPVGVLHCVRNNTTSTT
jgi:hypothetical protein